MIAEVSAVLSTLNAVNGALSTLRETKSNVQSISRVFSRVTSAQEGIATIEAEAAAGKRRLTPKQAMDIALAKRQIAEYDKEIKNIFLYAGAIDTYDDMKRIERQSVAAAIKRAKLQQANKIKKRQKTEIFLLTSIIVVILGLISILGIAILIKIN